MAESFDESRELRVYEGRDLEKITHTHTHIWHWMPHDAAPLFLQTFLRAKTMGMIRIGLASSTDSAPTRVKIPGRFLGPETPDHCDEKK